MFVRKLTPWPGFYLAPETGAESGGGEAGTGAGAADAGTGAGTGTESGKQDEEKKPEGETVEERAARLVDRYRNEAGQSAKKARELEAKLKEIEDAQKPELQRLTERAEQVPALEKERDDWKTRAETAEAALTAEVEARQKALPKEMLDLLPENSSPASQLEWIRKAQSAAERLKPGTLPRAGGRNPGQNGKANDPTDKERAEASRKMRQSF